MKKKNIMVKTIINKVIIISVISLNILMLSACTASTDTYISTTKLAVEYNNGYVYFYRHCDNFGCQGDEFSLVQYNTKTSEEKELERTNVVVGVRVYDDNIYYFDKDDHNLYALNEKSLKSKMIYDTQNSLAKNDYICFNSKLAYLDTGVLNIEDGYEKYHIENVWDFNVYKNQIYYVDVNLESENDWSIKELKNYNDIETETILTLNDVKLLFDDAYKQYGEIDNISLYSNKLYFTVSEYLTKNRRQLFCYDLDKKELNRVAGQYVFEYQVTENGVYCLEYDKKLRKYNLNGQSEEILTDVYSFKVVNDNILMYMNVHDNTLYIRSDSGTVSISNVLS